MKKPIVLFALIFIFTHDLSAQNTLILSNNTGASCDCWQQRDNTWSIVQFDGSGASGGPGTPPDYRNDDWSTTAINLPFSFCFYDVHYDQFFINNNGNISFRSPYSTYTGVSFPDTFSMIAPFWADVDTRGPFSGLVYYNVSPTHMIVQWDHVGYYAMHDDKFNTFQLIITDGNDSIIPIGQNVSFCYQDMQWTTGDASLGTNGFGGAPATVGINYGNGSNYIQFGRYVDSTYFYDGPFSLDDGVYSLNNKNFSFSTCVNTLNIRPILNEEFFCDTIRLCVGDTFTYGNQFIAPEVGQSVSISNITNGINNVSFQTVPGNFATFDMTFVAATAGIDSINILADDDGTPSATSSYTLIFDIQNCNTNLNEVSNEQLNIRSVIHDELTLNFQNPVSVSITDRLGRIIYEDGNSNSFNINTSSWSNGIYFISIVSDKKIISKKIIKQ